MQIPHIKITRKNLASTLLIIVGAFLVFYSLYINSLKKQPKSQESAPPSSSIAPPSSLQEEPVPAFPVGKLITTPEREAYVDGEMTLIVPRLNLDIPVFDGNSEEVMSKGVGLYDYGQLPGEGNRNTSIVGHRDIYGQEFYYIDTIVSGDLLYLEYDGMQYTYEYESTEIVDAENWDPIRVKEYPCLTLTSCDPIGTSLNRIIVTSRLVDISPIQEESHMPEVSSKEENPMEFVPQDNSPNSEMLPE